MNTEFKERMSKKSTEELIDIITKQRRDYQDDAIFAAEAEVRSRHLWSNEISNMIIESSQNERKSFTEENAITLEKKNWSRIRMGIILALMLIFLIDLLYRLSIGNRFAPLHKLPVVFLLSFWHSKYLTKGSVRLNFPFWKGVLFTSIYYIIVSTILYILHL